MLLLYSILAIALLSFFGIFLVSLLLVIRKIILNHLEKRDKRYYHYIFPLVSRYITSNEQFQYRIFHNAPDWKKRVIVRILLQLSIAINSKEEKERIHQVSQWIGLPARLAKQLRHRHWWKAAEAIRQAGLLQLDELVPLIAPHLSSGKYDVWAAAARALSHLNQNEILIDYLIRNHDRLQRKSMIRIADILRKITKEDELLMLRHIDDVSPLLKGLFFDLFGQAKTLRALSVLERYIDSDHPELRLKALKAIADIGITTRPDRILEFLDSEKWVEKMQAIRMIKACAMIYAVPQLVKLLGDRQWWVRFRAAETLYSFGTTGIDRLLWASEHHHDSYGRDMARQMLHEWHAKENVS